MFVLFYDEGGLFLITSLMFHLSFIQFENLPLNWPYWCGLPGLQCTISLVWSTIRDVRVEALWSDKRE